MKLTIESNQYVTGRGTTTMFTVSSYFYIQNENGETWHKDGKWRKKTLKDIRKYSFKTYQQAEDQICIIVDSYRLWFNLTFLFLHPKLNSYYYMFPSKEIAKDFFKDRGIDFNFSEKRVDERFQVVTHYEKYSQK
jgi:hypothetical protein